MFLLFIGLILFNPKPWANIDEMKQEKDSGNMYNIMMRVQMCAGKR